MPRDSPPIPGVDQTGSFPDAKQVHEEILAAPDEFPNGWVEQARFREEHDLPPFQPPRLTDGTRVRSIVRDLEDAHGVTLSFASYDVSEGWMVEIDGEPAFPIDRYRDDAANTIVDVGADRFRERVSENVDQR
jgi:hypothetical protein